MENKVRKGHAGEHVEITTVALSQMAYSFLYPITVFSARRKRLFE